MERLRPGQCGLISLALGRQHVQDHRPFGGLRELEHVNQVLEVVAVDRAEVMQSHLLEERARHNQALHRDLGLLFQLDDVAQVQFLECVSRFLVQGVIVGVRDDLVQIVGDCADVFGNRPLVVVEDADEFLRAMRDVVQRLEGDSASQGRIAEKGDDIFLGAAHVARRGHAESDREARARVAGAVVVMLAFESVEKAARAAKLAHPLNQVPPAGENLVDVALMADVHDETVFRRVEDVVHGQRHLDDAKIRAEVASRLRKDRDQLLPNLLRQRLQLLDGEALHIRRPVNRV